MVVGSFTELLPGRESTQKLILVSRISYTVELTSEQSLELGHRGSIRHGHKDWVFWGVYYLQTVKFDT